MYTCFDSNHHYMYFKCLNLLYFSLYFFFFCTLLVVKSRHRCCCCCTTALQCLCTRIHLLGWWWCIPSTVHYFVPLNLIIYMFTSLLTGRIPTPLLHDLRINIDSIFLCIGFMNASCNWTHTIFFVRL